MQNQSDDNTNRAADFSQAPDGINPWRSGSAYAALGCSTVGLVFSPVPFIGAAGLMVALAGTILAGRFQAAAMTRPRPAGASGHDWLRDLAWVCVFTLMVLGFAAVTAVSGASKAASGGSNGGSGGTLPVIILLSLGVAIALAQLVAASRDAEPPQLIPLALYWMCYVLLPTLLAGMMWDGSTIAN